MFTQQNIIDFLNIALQTTPGERCGDQAREINNLPKSYGDLTVEASVGIGIATGIPWISFLGYGQETSNGIYPVILFYHKKKILIVAFGVSATEAPERSWGSFGVKTLKQYFEERYISLEKREKIYNSSFVHSVFDIPVLNGKLDTSKFDIDDVFGCLNDVCKKYKELFENSHISSTAYAYDDNNYKMALNFIDSEILSVLSDDEKELLELIVNFRLPLVEEDVCFADILDDLEVEFSPGTEKEEAIRKQSVDAALLKNKLNKLNEQIRNIEVLNLDNLNDASSERMRSKLERMRSAASKAEKLLRQDSGKKVKFEIKLLGKFVPDNSPKAKVVIYYKNIMDIYGAKWKEVLAGVFVHEMFHAWNYFRAGENPGSVLAIDEPMVEFETLYFLKELAAFTDSHLHGKVESVYEDRKKRVQNKQSSIGDVAAYGFGYYLFEILGKSDYESIRWIETYSKKSAIINDPDSNDQHKRLVKNAEKALIPIYPFMSEADVMKLFRKIIFYGRVPFLTAFPAVKTGSEVSLRDLVLACIKVIGRKYFEAKELYAFKPIFKLCTAVSGNLEDALKKQLDELVKDGVLEVLSDGYYSRKS